MHSLQAQQPRISRAEGTHAIIIAPTRELCIQICDVLNLILRRFIWLVSTSCICLAATTLRQLALRQSPLADTDCRQHPSHHDHLHDTTQAIKSARQCAVSSGMLALAGQTEVHLPSDVYGQMCHIAGCASG